MSFAVTIIRTSGDSVFFDFGRSDVSLAHLVAQKDKYFSDHLQVIFQENDSDRESPKTSAKSLLTSVEALISILEKEYSLLPYHYQFTVTIPNIGTTSGAGGLGGIRINGEIFSLHASLGKCVLQKVATKSDGTKAIVDVHDLRTIREFKTDNLGIIKIKRRKKPTTLLDVLVRIRSFLAAIPPDEPLSIGAA